MTKQVYYLNRSCMDCGKDFLAVIEEESGKPLNCWYWGKIKPNLKYQYFIKFNSETWKHGQDDNHSGLQRWLKDNIPDYFYPEEEPSTKSIWKRWYLSIMNSLFNRHEEEMWTCPDCIEKLDKEVDEN